MIIILSKKGFSLLELIIATSLVGVVLLGIFAINNVLNNNNQDYGQRYLVKSDTQTTLNHILNNAALAVGSATTISGTSYPDQGIEIGNSGVNGDPNSYSFCIHQAAGNNILSNETTQDIWLCYTWNTPTGSTTDYEIQYCTMPYTTTVSPTNRGAANCNSASFTSVCNGLGNPPCSGPTYLGLANTMPTVSFVTTPGAAGFGTFSASITNCLDNFHITYPCGSTNNPEATVSGSVTPVQEGMTQN